MENRFDKKRKKLRQIKHKNPRDVQLLRRIKQIIGDDIHEQVDSDSIVEELRKCFPEYKRKKLNDFHATVNNCVMYLKDSSEEQGSETEESSDGKNVLVSYPDTNLVNQSISNMYRNSPKPIVNGSSDKTEEISKSTAVGEDDEIAVKRKKKDDPNRERKAKIQKKQEVLVQESQVSFQNVGGIERLTEEMWELLVQIRHPEIYEHLNVLPPRGFLLHGPPGSGKTLLANAIAGELKLPILKTAATELVTGVSGESEEKIRGLFDQAAASAPCILFIDEIDAITPKRETAQREMERRIVAQLLSCLDELSQKPASVQLVVIGATNRPDSLDPALRRAGRFDHEISLGIPDEEARIKILKVLCQNMKLHPDFDFRNLAHRSPGYVGADLMALCRKAATCAIRRVLDQTQVNSLLTNKEDPTEVQ